LPDFLRRATRSPLLLVAVFAAVSSFCATRHELWLDEANPWVIARDARSLAGLWFNMRFEPHPPLWYLLLYLLTRFTHNPAAMQAAHVLIASGSVAIVAWFAPFRTRDKWLLAFSYYLLFEYGVISRGYALGLLIAFSAVALLGRRRGTPVGLACLLALLANTSAFGLILSGALALGWLLTPRPTASRAAQLAAAAALYFSAVFVSLYSMIPGPEDVYGRNIHVSWSAERATDTLDLIWGAFLPIPDVRAAAPWNSNLFLAMSTGDSVLVRRAIALVSIALCAAVLWSLRKSIVAVAVFGSGILAVTVLLYVEYSAGYRHHGHYFVVFVLGLWLAAAIAEGRPYGRQLAAAFTALLTIQVGVGAYFAVEDIERPFSYSKEVAQYIQQLPPHSAVVVAQPEFLSYIGPPLSAYLGRRVYYAYSRGVTEGSYLVYDRVHRTGASEHQILGDVETLSDDFGIDVYVVANHWQPVVFGAPLVTFADHLVPDERDCSVYLFHTSLDQGRRRPLTSARGSTPARPSG
jgi:hypothetical protein